MVPKATPMGAFVSVLALALALLVACNVKQVPDGATLPAIDVTQVAPCPAPDGPGDGDHPTVPCVWDTQGRPDSEANTYGTRWILYVWDTCPVRTVQPTSDVHCVTRADWLGGIS